MWRGCSARSATSRWSRGPRAPRTGGAERTLYTGCFSAATGTYYAQFDGDPVLYAASLAQADEACPDALVECAFAPASFDA